jgi:hypothetical protein
MILSISGCDKNEEIELGSIDGTYNGSIREESSTNLSSKASYDFIVGEITTMGNQLEFNCYGEDIDITMMLEYFEHYENIMVCLTGNDYSYLYGHRHGAGMFSGMGINHMTSGNTDWERHLSSSHNQDDPHFLSGFNINDRTFNCTFDWNGATGKKMNYNARLIQPLGALC